MSQSSFNGASYLRIAPTISVSNIERSLEFYTRVLAFDILFKNGDPTGFAVLNKDQAEVHLTLNRQHQASTSSVCHLLVDDAATLYRHCMKTKVRIIKGIRDQPYGLRDFVIADPDGNRLDIGQVLTAGEED